MDAPLKHMCSVCMLHHIYIYIYMLPICVHVHLCSLMNCPSMVSKSQLILVHNKMYIFNRLVWHPPSSGTLTFRVHTRLDHTVLYVFNACVKFNEIRCSILQVLTQNCLTFDPSTSKVQTRLVHNWLLSQRLSGMSRNSLLILPPIVRERRADRSAHHHLNTLYLSFLKTRHCAEEMC